MPSTASFRPAAGGSADPQFEYERFDVYRVALEFQDLVPALFQRRGLAALRDQLDRASSSILLNIAEGAGRFARADKAQLSLVARGSAMESAAVLDVLLSRGSSNPPFTGMGAGCSCALRAPPPVTGIHVPASARISRLRSGHAVLDTTCSADYGIGSPSGCV